jgi:hypothetical protein
MSSSFLFSQRAVVVVGFLEKDAALAAVAADRWLRVSASPLFPFRILDYHVYSVFFWGQLLYMIRHFFFFLGL